MSAFAVLTPGTNVTISYDSVAGTITVSATTGGLTTEQVQDAVAAMIVAGTNITATYDDPAGTLTLASTATSGLTTEQVQDIVAAMVVAGTGITSTYDDPAGTLTLASTGGGGGLTTEQVQDTVAAMLIAGTNVTLTYDDPAGTLTVASSGGGGTVLPTVEDPSLWATNAANEEFNRTNESTLPTGWSWMNQNSSTYLERWGAGTVALGSGASTYNWMGIYKTTWFSTFPQSLTVHLVGIQQGNNSTNRYRQAIILRNSSTGAFAAFSVYLGDSNLTVENSYIELWASPTSFSSSTGGIVVPAGCTYMRVTRTADTTYTFHASPDGCAWIQIGTTTLSGYDQVGFAAMNGSGGAGSSVACHWLRIE